MQNIQPITNAGNCNGALTKVHDCVEEGALEYCSAWSKESHGETFEDEWWRCMICGSVWTAADLERSMSSEANDAYAEDLRLRTGRRIRRNPDSDEACELCFSDVADFVCDVCGKFTCSGCTVRYADGTYCLNHKPAETEAA